jgi:SPP1 family predicted phage head-tail adaptor
MWAGLLREKITVLAPSTTQNSYGEVVDTWTSVLETRAQLQPLIGREYFEAESTQSQVEVKFKLRYRSAIQNNYRVSHKGVTYHILSAIDVDGRGRELVLYCKKVTD